MAVWTILPLAPVSLIVNSMVDMENAESYLIDLTDGTILAGRDSRWVMIGLSGTDEDFSAECRLCRF